MSKQFLDLTSGDGRPIVIDPRVITIVEPWAPMIIVPGVDNPCGTRIRFGNTEPVFVTETSAQVRDLIYKLAGLEPRDSVAPVDADHAETPDEYAAVETIEDGHVILESGETIPIRPGTQHDEDHATDLARDTANGL